MIFDPTRIDDEILADRISTLVSMCMSQVMMLRKPNGRQITPAEAQTLMNKMVKAVLTERSEKLQ